jgi:hypothetical protein
MQNGYLIARITAAEELGLETWRKALQGLLQSERDAQRLLLTGWEGVVSLLEVAGV